MGLLQMLRGMVKSTDESADGRLLKLPLQLVLVVLAKDLDRIAEACKVEDDADLVLFRRILDELICGMPDAVREDWDKYIHAKTDRTAHLSRMKNLTDHFGRNGLRAYNCEEKICRFVQAIGIAGQAFPPKDWATRQLAREALATTVQILADTRASLSAGEQLSTAFESDLVRAKVLCLRHRWSEQSALKATDIAEF